MSLVYLITALPALKRGEHPALSRSLFLEKVTNILDLDLSLSHDFNLVLLLEEVNETIKTQANAIASEPEISKEGLKAALRAHRQTPKFDLCDHLWALCPMPYHALRRKWYQSVYDEAKSRFFKSWVSFSLNLDEVVAAILAKHNEVKSDDYLSQLEGRFDSSSLVIRNHYDEPGLGVDQRFSWFDEVKKALSSQDFMELEMSLNTIRLKEIDALLGPDLFSLDQVIAYYFKLTIIERESRFSFAHGKKILDSILNFETEELHGY